MDRLYFALLNMFCDVRSLQPPDLSALSNVRTNSSWILRNRLGMSAKRLNYKIFPPTASYCFPLSVEIYVDKCAKENPLRCVCKELFPDAIQFTTIQHIYSIMGERRRQVAYFGRVLVICQDFHGKSPKKQPQAHRTHTPTDF